MRRTTLPSHRLSFIIHRFFGLRLVAVAEPEPPSRRTPGLPRDLETIVLKCLQKEPAKRYTSAEAFADDLKRYLNREPIHARPVGKIERATKWVRRNPIPTIAAMAVVCCEMHRENEETNDPNENFFFFESY